MRTTRTYRSDPRRRKPPETRLQALLDRLDREPVFTLLTCLAAGLLLLAVAVDARGRNAVLSELPAAAGISAGEA